MNTFINCVQVTFKPFKSYIKKKKFKTNWFGIFATVSRREKWRAAVIMKCHNLNIRKCVESVKIVNELTMWITGVSRRKPKIIRKA